MKHKKKWLAVLVLLGSILVFVPFSMAYLSHVETKDNLVTVGNNDVMIEEDFTPPKEWQPNTVYKKNVKVRNTGTVPCFIRVYAVLSNTDIPATMDYNSAKWTKGSGDYWYYNDIVSPGAVTSSLITQVTIASADADQLKSFNIIIYAESIQAEGYKSINDAFNSIQ